MNKPSNILRATLSKIELGILPCISDKYLSEHAIVVSCAQDALKGTFLDKMESAHTAMLYAGIRGEFENSFAVVSRVYTRAMRHLKASFLDEVKKQASSSLLFHPREPAHEKLHASLRLVKMAENRVRHFFQEEGAYAVKASGFYTHGSVRRNTDDQQNLLRDTLAPTLLEAPAWHSRLGNVKAPGKLSYSGKLLCIVPEL